MTSGLARGRLLLAAACLLACAAVAVGAGDPAFGRRAADRTAVADGQGILRWREDGGELALFGVNYYTPCSINWNDIHTMGLSHDAVIEQDLAHLARLGLDALRLHVFDREVSDAAGNLIDNEHLRLLDLLIARAKARGFHTVLTPIAWWGVPGPSPGFSTGFAMERMTSDPAALGPQTNYLAQFVRHRNRYTGLTYGEDPAIAAFEAINEPLYPPEFSDDKVTAYINALADAIRAGGTTRPVFYNGWNGRLSALARARVAGSTFGWYPTGLVAGHALTRDALPRVDAYGNSSWNPPMDSTPMAGRARIVYEFDAADIGGGYMYPAMARAFRAGGAQIATQFQYDPLPLAPLNLGWQTHYLNLSYAPAKAVSFAIAAEAFRRLPRMKTFPPHPEGDRFDGFRVSFEEDLSEFVGDRVFMHSNTTTSAPPAPESLERIVGCGSSPVVRHAGTGAWFLDRLAPGMWRFETHPDAVWVADPFGKDRIDREVSRVLWREREVAIRLPDLGSAFAVEPLDAGNTSRPQVRGDTFAVRPGVYLLRRAGLAGDPPSAVPGVSVGLREFVAPPSSTRPPAAWCAVPQQHVAGRDLPLRFTLASEAEPQTLALEVVPGTNAVARRFTPAPAGPYRWTVTVPGSSMIEGRTTLRFRMTSGGVETLLPTNGGWTVDTVDPRSPVVVFDARVDGVRVGSRPPHRMRTVHGMWPTTRAMRIEVDAFDPPPSSLGFRHDAGEALDVRRPDLAGRTSMVVRARAALAGTSSIEVVLIERDGTPWGANVPLTATWREIRVPLDSLHHFGHWGGSPAGRGGAGDRLHPAEISGVSVCFGAWLYPGAFAQPHGYEIERIAIE